MSEYDDIPGAYAPRVFVSDLSPNPRYEDAFAPELVEYDQGSEDQPAKPVTAQDLLRAVSGCYGVMLAAEQMELSAAELDEYLRKWHVFVNEAWDHERVMQARVLAKVHPALDLHEPEPSESESAMRRYSETVEPR